MSCRRAPTHSHVVGRAGDRRGRPGPGQWSRRPGRARRAGRAGTPGSGPHPAVRHLPGSPDPGPRGGGDHVAPPVRPPWRQPPRQRPRHGACPHHKPESRVPGRRRVDSGRRLLRVPAQLERRFGRGSRPSPPAGLQRAVPPRGLSRTTGQPAPVRPVHRHGAQRRPHGEGGRGDAGRAASAQGPHPGVRPDRHRPGRRVRLRRDAGVQGAARGRHRDRAGQLQPRDDHDRRGHRRPRIPRTADGRGGDQHHRARAT